MGIEQCSTVPRLETNRLRNEYFIQLLISRLNSRLSKKRKCKVVDTFVHKFLWVWYPVASAYQCVQIPNQFIENTYGIRNPVTVYFEIFKDLTTSFLFRFQLSQRPSPWTCLACEKLAILPNGRC